MRIKNAISLILALSLTFASSGCQSVIEPLPSEPVPSPTQEQTPAPMSSPPMLTRFSDSESFPFPNDSELEVSESGNLMLTKQQALEDYDAMWETLEESFAFFDAIKAEKGVDHEQVREKYRAELLNIDEAGILMKQFNDVIDRCLFEFNPVGHLWSVSPSDYAYRVSIPIENQNENQTQMRAIMDSDKVRQSYEYLGSLNNAGSCLQTTAPEDRPDTEEIEQYLIDNQYIATRLFDNAAYIQVNQFLPPEDPNGYGAELVDMCKRFFKENRDYPNLIIDISENSGVGSMFWMELVFSLLSEPTPQYNILWGVKSGAYNQYIWNAEKPEGKAFSPSDSQWREMFPNVKPSAVEGMDWLIISERESLMPSEDSVRYAGRIWVLTGRGTYSAADEFSIFCKNTGFAKLVGSATSGNGAGRAPHWFALPNSGLLISYEAYHAFNDNGACNAIVGTSPDIEAKEGQTALEACLEQIQGGISGNP